jgi:hypothetical protein
VTRCAFLNELIAKAKPGACIICDEKLPPPLKFGARRKMHADCLPTYMQIYLAGRPHRKHRAKKVPKAILCPECGESEAVPHRKSCPTLTQVGGASC